MRNLQRFWSRTLFQVLLPLALYSVYLAYWVQTYSVPLETYRVASSALAGIALGLALRPRASEMRRTDLGFCYFTRPPAVSICVALFATAGALLTASLGLQYLGLSSAVGFLVLALLIIWFERRYGLPVYDGR